MPGETEKEQNGLDSLSLIPSLGGGRLDAAREAHTSTRPSARTMALLIPAPRGPILDRIGEPLAVTSVAYQLALRFEIFENPDRSRVVEFGRNCLEQAKKIAGKAWSFSDEQLWKHYEHRRWLPLPLTNVIRAEEAEKLKDKVKSVRCLQLLPIYIRSFPEKEILPVSCGSVPAILCAAIFSSPISAVSTRIIRRYGSRSSTVPPSDVRSFWKTARLS